MRYLKTHMITLSVKSKTIIFCGLSPTTSYQLDLTDDIFDVTCRRCQIKYTKKLLKNIRKKKINA